MSKEQDLERAISQGRAQIESIVEMVDALVAAQEGDGDEDGAREAISQDPLSVEVRAGWYSPFDDAPEPEEFRILLCTGGPAAQIVGELSEHNEPTKPRLQVQDWFLPWTDVELSEDEQEAMERYCQCFYFGD